MSSTTTTAAILTDLRAQIEEHDLLYYVDDAPAITDLAYDALRRQLEILEARHPELVTPGSPTQRVGAASAKATAPHTTPMLSMNAAYDLDEVRDFDAQATAALDAPPAYYVARKIDGLAVSLIYRYGVLTSALTRGNGKQGEDVTEAATAMLGIPTVLTGTPPDWLEVRGEVYITTSALKLTNDLQAARGLKPYPNARACASASLRSADPSIAFERGLELVAFDALDLDGNRLGTTLSEAIGLMTGGGLPTDRHGCTASDINTALEIAADLAALADEVPTDGVVLTINTRADQHRLGETARAPRWAIAIKCHIPPAPRFLDKEATHE